MHFPLALTLTSHACRYVMYENAMSILKLGASLEGLLGLEGSMTWTVTQKLGATAKKGFDIQKFISSISVFPRELFVGFFLIGAALYGRSVGASWVFTVYFFTQASRASPSPSARARARTLALTLRPLGRRPAGPRRPLLSPVT